MNGCKDCDRFFDIARHRFMTPIEEREWEEHKKMHLQKKIVEDRLERDNE